MIKKPMLAKTLEKLDDLPESHTEYYVQPKWDGIRTLVGTDGKLYSRSGKLIRNTYLQSLVTEDMIGLDGELLLPSIEVDNFDESQFQLTSSIVMSQEHEFSNKVVYMIYDNWLVGGTYLERLENIMNVCGDYSWLNMTKTEVAINLQKTVLEHTELSGEGAIIRLGSSLYKHGRATKELYKYKEFLDLEATIINTYPKWANQNEAVKNVFGRSERSSKKDGKVKLDTLGGLTCQLPNGKVFGVGSGFTDELRKQLWDNRQSIVGKTITVKYQILTPDGAPRFPVFLRFREEE